VAHIHEGSFIVEGGLSVELNTTDIQALLNKANRLEITQSERRKQYDNLMEQALKLQEEMQIDEKELQTYVCACNLIGEVSDETTQDTLNKISSVINKALGVLFPNDSRTVRISKSMYRDVHPHFNVDLITESGVVRSFKQSGSGLAQVISFLFTICLIDARGGRKFLVMDELLNGLHPTAKGIVRDLMQAVSNRFQFLTVEYGMDIDKEYFIEKHDGTATLEPYEGNSYYKDLVLNGVEAE